MKMRYVAASALVTAIAFTGGVAWAQHHGHGQQHDGGHGTVAPDTRILVKFPPMLAEHTLTNMRDHLLALQEITDALAQGAPDRAARIAENRLGMSSLKVHGAHEVAKFMPQGMQDAGTAMHHAASRFAIEAQNAGVTGDLKPALAVLGEVMNACVSCHAGYRLK